MRTTGSVHKISILATTGLAVVLMALAQPAFSQEKKAEGESENLSLKPIVIKGARNAKGSVTDTPAASTTTADEVRKKEIDSLTDVGNTTEPGVFYNRSTGVVNIRGLQDDRVLTTIDGIPIPFFDAQARTAVRGGVDSYDFSALSTFDVLYGADASRLGSGAMGGAIVLRTLEPEDLIAPGKTFGGIAKFTYDGSDKSFIGSGAVAQRIQNTSVLFQGSYKRGHELQNTGDVGGYGTARTEADPNDTDRSNLMFKLRQALEGGHTVGLTAERYRIDSDTDVNSNAGTTYDNTSYRQNVENKRDRVSLDYRFESQDDDSLVNNAFATFYWQKANRILGTDAYRISSLIGPYTRNYDMTEERYGANGYANLDFDTGALSHSLTLGGDFSIGENSQYMSGEDNCTRGTATARELASTCPFLHINQSDTPDIDSYRIGLFAEDRIAIGDSPFAITPGIRYDWFRYKPVMTDSYAENSGYDGLPDETSGNRFSPKLRASWQATPALEFFAQVSTTYKAPSIDQLYLNYASAYYASVGNPDLNPETGYGFDIGAKFGDQESGGKITFFANRYKNFIDTVTIPSDQYPYGVTTYRNLDKARIAGIEIKAHHNFANGVNVHAAASYSKGVNLDDDIDLSSSQPFKGVFGVGYNAENWGTDVSLVAASHINQVVSGTSTTRRIPGYGIVNLTGWWEPTQAKGMRLQAGVYNLFDQEYYDAVAVSSVSSLTEFYSEAGRHFKVSLTQKF